MTKNYLKKKGLISDLEILKIYENVSHEKNAPREEKLAQKILKTKETTTKETTTLIQNKMKNGEMIN